jgi:hypothetical protein
MKIEHNVPIPDVYQIKKTVLKMKSGDSVFFRSFKVVFFARCLWAHEFGKDNP